MTETELVTEIRRLVALHGNSPQVAELRRQLLAARGGPMPRPTTTNAIDASGTYTADDAPGCIPIFRPRR